MAQPSFGSIALFAQMILTEGSTDSYRQVPDVIHADAVGGATADELRHRLWLRLIDKVDAGNLPFPHTQHFQFAPPLPVGRWVFGQHHVVIFRLQAYGELLRR